MNNLLDDVRRDAIEKLKSAEDKDISLLLDAVCHIQSLHRLARKEGLFALEETIENPYPNFLEQPFLLIIEAVDPDEIIEISTNEYWVKNPQGIYAMLAYFHIRGALCIQAGVHPDSLRNIMRSLIPSGWHQKYQKQMDESEKQYQEQIYERYKRITPPVILDYNISGNIHALEKQLSNLSTKSIQRLVRDIESSSLAKCVFVLKSEISAKIMANLSERYANSIMEKVIDESHYRRPSDDEWEKQIFKAVLEVLSILNKLRDAGEL